MAPSMPRQNDSIVRYAVPAGGDRADGNAASHRFGPAADRRSPDASLHHRREGRDLFVDLGSATNACQIAEPHRQLAGPPALHRARDPRRHLASTTPTTRTNVSRRQSATSPGCAMAKALRSMPPGASLRPSMAATSSRRTGRASTHAAKRADLPAEELVLLKQRRRLWLARMLLRSVPEEAGAGAGIWRRRRQEGRRMR